IDVNRNQTIEDMLISSGFHYEVAPNLTNVAEPVRLGKNIAYDKEIPTPDGVIFPKKKLTTAGVEENVLYLGKDEQGNDIKTPLTIHATYDGYATVWIGDNGVNISGTEPVKVVGGTPTEIWVTVPSDNYAVNTSHHIRVRYSPLKDDVNTFSGVAALGEVEDYMNIRFVSPIKVTGIKVEDLGVDLDGDFNTTDDVYEANDKIVKYHERVKYTVTVENNSNSNVLLEDVVFETNVGNYIEGSLKVIDENPTINRGMSKTVSDEKYLYIPKNIIVSNQQPLTYTFEILENREDIDFPHAEWRNRDRIYQGGVEYYNILNSTLNSGMINTLLNRQYVTPTEYYDTSGSREPNYQNTARHYELTIDGKIPRLGEKYQRFNDNEIRETDFCSNSVCYRPALRTGDGIEFDQEIVNGSWRDVIISDAITELKIKKASHDGFVNVWIGEPYKYYTIHNNEEYVNTPTSDIKWRNITIKQSPVEIKAGENIKVPIKIADSIVGKEVYLRVRYSPRKADVLNVYDSVQSKGAVTGETEDYHVYGIPPLDAKFNDYEDKSHEKLGI
uniref:hypothetical protein n=1 Tax=Fusobacterium mortiferum TaxID=850 RepID=UPI003FEDC2C7